MSAKDSDRLVFDDMGTNFTGPPSASTLSQLFVTGANRSDAQLAVPLCSQSACLHAAEQRLIAPMPYKMRVGFDMLHTC